MTPPAKSRKKRDQLIAVGQRMSNFLFNLKQASALPKQWRESAESLQEEWDAIKRGEVRDATHNRAN